MTPDSVVQIIRQAFMATFWLAAPMLGGLFTSFLMELLIYPIIFFIAKGIKLEASHA